MSEQTSEIDRFDRKILDVLAVDGRISVTELARRIGLSKSPTQARLAGLRIAALFAGIVRSMIRSGLGATMSPLSRSNCRHPRGSLAAFNAACSKIAEIEQCHLIAGRV